MIDEPKQGDFGQALKWLKAGKRVRLPGWYEPYEGSAWLTLDGSSIRLWWLNGAASDEWEPNHEDLLREDWEVVE